MAQPDNNKQLSSAFKTFFERETLIGANFNDWYCSLRIVLRVADTYEYLYKPCPNQPLETASEEDKAAWKAKYKKHNDAVEIYDLVDALHSCKQASTKSVSAHVLEMKGKIVTELHALLIDYENGLKDKAPTPQVLTIQKTGQRKRNCPLYLKELRKNKDKVEHGAATLESESLGSPPELIHVRRSERTTRAPNRLCLNIEAVEIYDLVDALHSYKQATGKSVIAHVLEMKVDMHQLHALGKSYDNDMPINLINRSLNKDFGDFVRNFNMHCVGKTVTELHALLIDYEKGLKDKAPTPQVLTIQKGRENKPKSQANKKDKRSDLSPLPRSWTLEEELPTLPQRVAKNKDNAEHDVAALGFKEERKLSYGEQYMQVGNGAQVAVEAIGVFDLVLPSGLHSILAHIGKTRMQKLQCERLMESINDESFDKCESCISGKMTKKPFSRNIERDTYLLGLIHTDVCRPVRHVSRKGASYFLTFTDDFSCYGYVYLLKHKHKVFENFKVFKSEVELQLGKKIKALYFDRGGEYLSQEFKDYLSKNGIVQHLTSPYTLQQNGVSERRNRTLLDMVRSMFNLTTLPLSFWDYALESVVRILNMVSTKKVDKTLYEIWHGKAPNLSYLKETMGYYFYFPPENKVIVSRSERTTRAPNRLCLNIEVKDDEVGDLGELANYKAAMLDPDKKIDVETAFLNGRLDEDIYMEQLEGLKEVNDYLGKCFSMKDLGEAAYVLGIKIYRDRSRLLIGLSQSAYIDKILKKYNIYNFKKGYFPMEVKHDLSNELCASTPEENPGKLHWVAVKHILKYLRNTRDIFLVYGRKPDTELDVTTQAEYVAASEAAMEAVWIRNFFGDLGVMPSINKPINMYCDNSFAIIFANELGIKKGARHFLQRYHYVREQVDTCEIKLIKVHTDDNLVDPFTKALPRGMVIDHAKGIRL
nr:hypothetical protein [Tanacetum cinerariifolium]